MSFYKKVLGIEDLPVDACPGCFRTMLRGVSNKVLLCFECKTFSPVAKPSLKVRVNAELKNHRQLETMALDFLHMHGDDL